MASASYQHAIQFVSQALSSSSKKSGHQPTRRDFKGRVFPKASLRALARKANIARLAYGPSADGVAENPEKDTYGWIDQYTFNILENILYDAITIADATKKSSASCSGRIIKERHMIRALERHGGLGLGSIEGRKTLF